VALVLLLWPSTGSAARTVAIGAYHPGLPTLTAVQQVDQVAGKRIAIAHWYQAWANDPTFPSAATRALLQDGRTPMVTWEPWDYRLGTAQTTYPLSAIAAGAQDTYVRSWAQAIKAMPGPVLVRFAHEMNGTWYPWAIRVNGNSAGDYVAAFRHVVDVFRAEGATNARFVWAPNVEFVGSSPLEASYPGDTYVDWVGIDGYNWGTAAGTRQWQTFDHVFRATYDHLGVLAPSRRVMISEVASAEVGGSKANWIADALGDAVPNRYPRVAAVLWFDEKKEADWRIDSSSQASSAFRRAMRQGVYASVASP
jgi:beta-mannanase